MFKRPLNYPVAFPFRRLDWLGGDFCDVIFAGYLNRISGLVFQGTFFNWLRLAEPKIMQEHFRFKLFDSELCSLHDNLLARQMFCLGSV